MPPDEVFVGREAELSQLHAALEDIRAARPRVVMVEGPAGMGKTALVRHCFAGQGDVRVLWVSGDEAEIAVANGVADQLAGQVDPLAPRRWMAAGADLLPGPLAVGAEVVEALGSLQDQGPVALVVDDTHWSDLPSLQALTFALRRLHTDRVIAVFLARDEGLSRLPEGLTRLLSGDRGLHLRLVGLGPRVIQSLATAMGRGQLSQRGAVSLQSHTGGNPLYARALLEELSPELVAASPGPLPAPRSFALTVLARLAGCPEESRRLVVAGSVLGIRFSLADSACLAAVGEPLVALEQAAASGLVLAPSFGEARVMFAHPLVQASIYHDLGPAQRADLHRRAAEMAGDEASALRHLIAATHDHDAALCSRVVALAQREAARGAFSSAGSHLLSAAGLADGQEDAEHLLLGALEFMLLAGDVAEAAALATRVDCFDNPTLRSFGLGFLKLVTGPLVEADELLSAAWADCDAGREPAIAPRLAGQLGLLRTTQGRGRESGDLGRFVLGVTPPGAPPALGARGNLLLGYAIAGSPQEGLAVAAAANAGEEPSRDDYEYLLARGWVRLWTDDLEGAQGDVSCVARGWRDTVAVFGVFSLAVLSEIKYRQGAWDEAVSYGDLAGSAVDDSGQVWIQAHVHGMVTYPLAARGQWEAAERHANRAWEVAKMVGEGAPMAFSCSALALVAHARGEWNEVVESVDPLLHVTYRDGTYEPGVLPWREAYLEALVALGRLDDAESGLIPFEEVTAARGRRSAMGNAARVRGKLEAARGSVDKAEAAFLAGLRHSGAVPIPFDLAQTELAYGGLLRRAGQRGKAVEQLKSARDRLAALKAVPYLERCDRELAACGLTPVKRRGGARPGQLTPQELSVARLVTSGLTNRQVASELVVSTKTVEYHLANVFTKLGVSSRTQLAAHLAKR